MRDSICRFMSSFGRDRGGGFALIFGLGLPVLLALVGGSIDYAQLVARKSQLQGAVDMGVLTGGNALKLAGSNPQTVKALTENTIQVAARPPNPTAFSVNAEVLAQNDGVFATAKEAVKLHFGGLIGWKSVSVAVTARANIVGKMRLCMLTTDRNSMGSLSLQSNARITAENCSLYTNSNSGRALIGEANAMARAETICSVGGYDGPRANFQPTPRTECPIVKDPLSARLGPAPGSCKSVPPPSSGGDPITAALCHLDPGHAQLNSITNSALGIPNQIISSMTLDPGTYCGGLIITGNAVVTLRPGNYVIKDGPLIIDQQASLLGDGVSIYFTGSGSGLLFNTNTTISLTAPTNGQMAGILLSDDDQVSSVVDPALYLNAWLSSLPPPPHCTLGGSPVSLTPSPLGQSSSMRMYRILSNNTRQMLGTIHLPGGRLVLDGDRPVADQSNYTVVVAQQVNLYKGPNLVLNANYDRSNVPVPVGVGPLPGQVRLTQ